MKKLHRSPVLSPPDGRMTTKLNRASKPPESLIRRLGTKISEYRFALLAFLVPLGIRAIPEIIVGPYPIGWDTIAFYVPNTLDWATGKVGPLEMLGTAPLMYMISVPIYMVSHVNPVWIFKVIGPVLYGNMIFALFRFIRLGLDWNNRMALGGALLTSLYFVTLRISWDLYRNMLGLTFVLLALVFLHHPRGLKSQGLLALSIIGAVAADPLTGIIVLFLVGSRALAEMLNGAKKQFRDLVLIGTPGIALFLAIEYAALAAFGIGVLQQQFPLTDAQNLSDSIGFLGFAYLPLSPLIALGFRRVRNLELRIWGMLSIAAAFGALMPFFGPYVVSYRWSLLASVPLCVLAAAGLARLSSTELNVGLRKMVQARILPLSSLVIILSAILYIAIPAQQAMPYYTTFPTLLTTSMLQNTVPLSDMGNLKELLGWVNARSGHGTALITHEAIYGWARAYAPSEPIINYRYSSPLEGVQLAREQGYSSILMVWWVNGSGWLGQPAVPSGFVPVVLDGNMAVYAYY